MTLIKNVPSNRAVMYVLPMAITFALIILLLAYFLGESLIEAGVFALLLIPAVLVVFLASRKIPTGIGVSAKGIQLILKRQGRIMIPWKDVVSLISVKRDPGMYRLRCFRSDGRPAAVGLSEEPAEEVRRMWSKVFPDGRDISEDAHFRSPTSHER